MRKIVILDYGKRRIGQKFSLVYSLRKCISIMLVIVLHHHLMLKNHFDFLLVLTQDYGPVLGQDICVPDLIIEAGPA